MLHDYSSEEEQERPPRREKDDDRGLRIEIPEFEGSMSPDDFVDWLHAIERVFEYKGYSDEKKCKLAILKFKDYASLWWENLKKQRERDGKERVRSWEKLKKLMKRRFLPDNHKQDLYLKLHTLKQGSDGVEHYIREFEKLLMRSELPEVKEQTIARFIGGLNQDIAHMVELQPYCTFEDVCKLAIKVEKQKKAMKPMVSKSFSKGTLSNKSISFTKGTTFHKGSPSYTNVVDSSSKEKGKEKMVEPTKDKPNMVKTNLSNKKCFKCQGYGHFQAECPNRRVLSLMEIQAIEESLQEEEESEVSSHESDEANKEEEEILQGADEGELLVIRRALHAKPLPQEEQRLHIFQSRCTIGDKVCSLIIDSGSCANVASSTLVEKLGLPTIPHPQPYKIQWLSNGTSLQVAKQVLISFSIGKHYSDEILCDVIPMDACHLLLGRPWQFDREVKHDGKKNTYSFKFNGKTITLTPLSPQQVHKATKGKEVKKESLFMNGQQVEGSHLEDLRANPSQPGEDDVYAAPLSFLGSKPSLSLHATFEAKKNKVLANPKPKEALHLQFWPKTTFGYSLITSTQGPNE